MSSMRRTIRRKMMFTGMNKQQRIMWSAEHGGKNNRRKQELAGQIKKGR